MGKPGSEGMTVTGGNRRRVQVRKEREAGFCEAKRRIVLDHLAGCCAAPAVRLRACGVPFRASTLSTSARQRGGRGPFLD
jgi:hypothetical protein